MKYWHGWYRVEDNITFTDEAWDWAQATFGQPQETGRWFYQNGCYFFKQAKDAMLYELAWSGHEDAILEDLV